MGVFITDEQLHRIVRALQDRVGGLETDDGEARMAALAGLDVLSIVLEPPHGDDAGDPPDDGAEVEDHHRPDDDAEEDPGEPDDDTGDVGAAEEPRPAPAPAAAEAPAPSRWTAEREALLRDLWVKPAISGVAILKRLDALPGPPMGTNTGLLYARAKALGLPGKRAEPEPPAELADAAVAGVQERARAMLRDGADSAAVATATKLPLREVLRLGMEVREARRTGAPDA